MGKVVTVKNIKKKEIMVIFEIIFCNYIISNMNMQYNQNQNQSSCDCSGNNNMFNMNNNGNPQHQLNLNNQMNNQIHNHQMNNQMPQQLDLSNAMGIPNNTLDLNGSSQQQQANNVAKKDLIDSLNKIGSHDESVKGAVKDSYYILLKNINLAFILVAAFAWNDAVKYYIAKLIRSQQGSPYYYLYYALIVTLLAVLSVRLTRKFLIGN